MNYVVNNYQLIFHNNTCYFYSDLFAAKLGHPQIISILDFISTAQLGYLSEDDLLDLSQKYKVPLDTLLHYLQNQIKAIKPIPKETLEHIYINSDLEIVAELLKQDLIKYYPVSIDKNYYGDQSNTLTIFFRKNYSNSDFSKLYKSKNKRHYLITAGVLQDTLIIDNLYYPNSGLPTHFSNYWELIRSIDSKVPIGKQNWFGFCRYLIQNGFEHFPDPFINACQAGYIAYSLHSNVQQFAGFWSEIGVLDDLKWRWQVNLRSFEIHKEIAIHSPFSKYDMRLDLDEAMEVGDA